MSLINHKTTTNSQADIFFALAIILVVALLVVPIPTILIDILICANISLALIVLLLSIYVPNTLKLSTFPTILLLTTLFRLGLNVATSRLILLNADAGEVVMAFGNSVVGGNLVVGTVIFLLLMLINMLVVAKGSERVAEVSARFTLDAMPGKQMSIDADLRAGALDLEKAKQKRFELQRESQLFGAMDGAMKFVKGDVIAGIIIFIVNIVAGIIIGKIDHGMDLSEALSTYTILSVGDGLVSIIPGLLMSICAGLIVTRVESVGDNINLGSDVISQILSLPKALLLASMFMMGIGLLPGLPLFPFAILSILVFFLSLKGLKKPILNKETNDQKNKASLEPFFDIKNPSDTNFSPVIIEVSLNLVPFVDDKTNFIDELIPLMRQGLEEDTGLLFPGIKVRCNNDLEPCSYVLLLNDIPVDKGHIDPAKCMVQALASDIKDLGINDIQHMKNPANNMNCCLVSIDKKSLLEEKNFLVWDIKTLILLHLAHILRKNAHEFLTIQETQSMLDKLEKESPALVKEVVTKIINLCQLTDVLKRLLQEDIPIRDLKSILQALALHGSYQQNTIMLTELIRTSMSRLICYRLSQGYESLLVYLLSPQIEEIIRNSIEEDQGVSFLALDPKISRDLLEAFLEEISAVSLEARKPVILTTQEIRRFVKKLIENEFPHVAVISFQELNPEIRVQPIGRVFLPNEQEKEDDNDVLDNEDHFALAPTPV